MKDVNWWDQVTCDPCSISVFEASTNVREQQFCNVLCVCECEPAISVSQRSDSLPLFHRSAGVSLFFCFFALQCEAAAK